MNNKLKIGLEFEFQYVVPQSKTVPYLYPEAEEFQCMPEVFATGFMIGFMEWACIKALVPYLNWPEELSLGTDVNISHIAGTPIGATVTAKVKLFQIDGKRLVFEVEVYDDLDLIAKGFHERHLVSKEKFTEKMGKKSEKIKNS